MFCNCLKQDPHDLIKDECKVTPACQRIDLKLADCTNRVQGAGDETEETCHEEISALAHCIDHCVSLGVSSPCY